MTLPHPSKVSKKLAQFDALPDDAIVGDPVGAALLDMSLDTYKRIRPVPRRQFSKRRGGSRVGDLRALVRS
jgi:hypothetical protein